MQKNRQAKFRGISGALLLALLLIVPAQYAQAQRKTDVITLVNGDRITGEIKALSQGRVSLSTDSMGTVSIEWDDIAALDSNHNYEVRLGDGERIFGMLHAGDTPGTIGITDVFGEKKFARQDIVEMRPVQNTPLDRLDVYLSANYAYTKASGVQQTEFNADVTYDQRNAVNKLTSRVTLSETDEDATSSSKINVERRLWTGRKKLYRLLNVGYESNDELALEGRYTVGGGFGRYFIDTNNTTLSGGFSLQALTERSLSGENQQSVEAVISGDFTHWRFDTPELDLEVGFSAYPSLTEKGRLRADNNIRIKWEIIDDLFWNVNLWASYDNSSVDMEGGETDWGVTTGLGWTF